MWVRTREDRAGDRRLDLNALKKLCELNEIVIGFRSEGKVKKMKIGNGSIRDLVTQIQTRAEECGRSVYVWGAKARNVVEFENVEKEVEQQQ